MKATVRLRARALACSLFGGVLLAAGCTSHRAQTPDERLRSQAAQDARAVHHDLKEAGKDAKQALGKAGRETRDIVAGAREGWREGAARDGALVGSGAHARLDINRASAADLERLPGVSASSARKIAAGQPYGSTKDLVKRGILSESEYTRIHDRITTR